MRETVEVLQEDLVKIYKLSLFGKIVEPDPDDLFAKIGRIVFKYHNGSFDEDISLKAICDSLEKEPQKNIVKES